MRTLSHGEVKAFYDWFGARQDGQRFYEDAAVEDLMAHADFRHAHAAFEFGCGTGRLADRLLAEHLPSDCRYRAVDISTTMVRLARERLARWGQRVVVEQTSGSVLLDAESSSFDRFLVTYVLDLLEAEDISGLLDEAHRVLEPGALLCTVGLTRGRSLPAGIVDLVWHGLFRLNPKLVGGCRAIAVGDYLRDGAWSLRHHNVITRFGVSSEVVVAARRDGKGTGA